MKLKNQQARDAFDMQNLGGYERIYPHSDKKLSAYYDELLVSAARLWQEFTTRVSRSTVQACKPGSLQGIASPTQRQKLEGVLDGKKTDPAGVKAKAKMPITS